MARMNISIPDSTKAEMDLLSSVNWSALAAQAFDREIRKSRKVNAMNTQQVVERLQASYEETKSEEEEAGHELGVKFASENAEAAELIWMEANKDCVADCFYEWEFSDGPFVEVTQTEFWGSIMDLEGDDIPLSRSYVKGFVEGAIEAWVSVKEQVRA